MVSDDFPIDHFATFIDVVRTQAERYGEQNLYRFLRDGDVDGTVDSLSFGALDRRARAIGARLRAERGVAERALLLYPPGLDYVTAFFGCLLGGTIAVPAYPPDPTRLDRTLPRLRAIVRDCGAKFVLTTSAIAALAEALTATAPDLARLRWIATDTIADEEASRWRAPDCTAESLAFLQYTSGSTGAPRGVMVTHRNLLANSAHIAAATGRSLSTVGVLWLPPYHDMGLIGGIVQPLYIARPVVLMSPVAFLQRPARWLQAISRFRATISAGPDFALALCCRKVSPEERAALDLSSCDIIFDGAEPIRGETIDRFMEVFRPAGLRPQVIHPCYGLAESTLIVSGAHRPRPLVKLAVQAAEMARDRVVLAQDPADARTLIGCGRPAQQVLIVHPETRLALDSGEVGEIWVRGASVATGYWGNQEESELAFAARLADSGEGPYLRTGDLGFLHDGELFVTGRLKDLLILHGKNHYPQDLERTIERAHPAIRPGAVAAFAVEHAGEEALAVVAEVDLRRGNVTPGAVIAAIKEAVLTEHEVRAERVVLLPPGRIPKTSSGKLQRRTCRDELLAGRLEVLASYPTLAAPAAAPIAAATDLYPRLDEIADRVDMRSTRYRFDLETSVAWNRLNEPGDYLPPGLADFFGVDVPALQRVPGAWETFQWAAALATCDSFIETEEMVTHFIRAGRAALGGRRSLTLLEEEEDKHILLFRRYADHLRAERPELALAYQSRYTSMFLDMPYQDSVEFHYTVWVNILFFEEYTIWIHDRLRAESAAVQPAWLSAHAAHAREELQHVVTDHAWLWALGATAAQREAWSKRLFGEIISIVSNFAMPVENLLGLCEEQFPELQGMTATRRRRGPSFLALIQDRAFRRTREAAPYFAQIVKSAGTAQPVMRSERVSRAVTHAEVVDWLCAWLGTKLRVDAAAVDRRATFTQHGLDSVAAISLSGELEAWLGCRLSATLAYDYPTVDLVAQAVAAAVSGLSERTSGSDVTASAEPGHFASARQTRLWFLEQAFPGAILDHLTTVYELRGALDVDLLHGALQALAARHPALRTTFRESSGRVEQVVGAGELRSICSCLKVAKRKCSSRRASVRRRWTRHLLISAADPFCVSSSYAAALRVVRSYWRCITSRPMAGRWASCSPSSPRCTKRSPAPRPPRCCRSAPIRWIWRAKRKRCCAPRKANAG